MGRNIGTLGRVLEPLDLEFTYFEATTIRVHPQATDAVELEFLQAGRDVDVSELQGLDLAAVNTMSPLQQAELLQRYGAAVTAGYQALLSSLQRLVHPADWDTYWRLAMDNGQQVRDLMADIKAITTAVVEARTDFPTGPQSASPTGPTTTPPASADGSPSPAPQQLGPTELNVALALERGRPDIQEFYVMEDENRRAREQQARERDLRDREKLAAAGLRIG